MLAAAPAVAHVALDAPNGGEILEPGSTFTITWHDSVCHGAALVVAVGGLKTVICVQ